MRRIFPLVVVAGLCWPAAAAQTLHQDPAQATDDYSVLRWLAGSVLVTSVEGLNRSLDLDPVAAAGKLGIASALSNHAEDAARLNASAATSRERLVPLASAASALSSNLTSLVSDWRNWTTLNASGFSTTVQAVQARLALAALHADLAAASTDATTYRGLVYDTSWLEAALREFHHRVDAIPAPALPRDETASLFLEASPQEVPLTHVLTLRGVLLAPSPAGVAVRIEVDGHAWGNTTTDALGTFALHITLPRDTLVGLHVATATADGLVSDPVNFTVLRIPTALALTVLPTRVIKNATAVVSLRLVEDGARPLVGNVTVAIDGIPLANASTDADGDAPRVLDTAGLALGRHVVAARYAGSRTDAPSEAIATFEVARATPTGQGGLARATPTSQLFLAFTLFAVLLVAMAFLIRSRWRRKGIKGPRDGVELPLATRASVEEKAAPLAAVSAGTPDLVRLYRELLERLTAQGIDVRPFTHREVGEFLLARGAPEPSVHAVTDAVERALYAGESPEHLDTPSLRAELARLGASA
ncbi:MAG: DUF4129 domain-containing protein [Thermoplasmatota archaeon]